MDRVPVLADLIETAATVLRSALAYTGDPDLREPILEALWLTEAVQNAVPPRHFDMGPAKARVADRIALRRAEKEAASRPAAPVVTVPLAPFRPIEKPHTSFPSEHFDPTRARLAATEAI